MASTYTSKLRLEKQATGENSNTWGSRLNTNVIDMVDQAVAGFTSIALTNASRTLTTNNGASDEARAAMLQLTGVLASNVNVVIPAQSKQYIVRNATTGAFTVTMKVAGQGVALPQGYTTLVFTDGTTVRSSWGTAGNRNIGTGATNVPDTSIADIRYLRTSAADTRYVLASAAGNIRGKKTFTSVATFNAAVSISSRLNVILSTTLVKLRVDGTADFTSIVNVSGPSRTPILRLTDAASVKVSLNRGNFFFVCLAGNRVLENPRNQTAGQSGLIYVFQDGTGSRTLSYGNNYKFSGGTAPTLSTSVHSTDILSYNVRRTSVVDISPLLNLK